MLSRLKHQYRIARLAWRFVMREEMKSPTRMPWLQRMAYLRRGYLSEAGELYDRAASALADYLSDWAKARMSMMYDRRNIRAGYQYGLGNKLFSTPILGEMLRVPKIYAIIERGQVLPLADPSEQVIVGSWSDTCRRAGGKLFVKPSADARGRGVFMLSERDGQLYMDDLPASEEEVQARIESLDEYIIVEYLQQGAYAAGLFSESTNTIRVLTMIDPDSGEPYLPIAVQRIGSRLSRPVDNFGRGGICAEVEQSTGVLSAAASFDRITRKVAWHPTHPDTGASIEGVQVPNWDAIKSAMLNAASRLAYYKYISWDVVVLEDGIGVLEADTVSGIDILQVHRPLLRDERLRRFFEYHGYVRPRRASAAASNGQVRPAT